MGISYQNRDTAENSILFIFLTCTHLFEKQREIGQAQARNGELHVGFLHGWQELTYLSHPVLPPRHVSRKLDGQQDLPSTPVLDAGIPNSGLTHSTVTPAPYFIS